MNAINTHRMNWSAETKIIMIHLPISFLESFDPVFLDLALCRESCQQRMTELILFTKKIYLSSSIY